MALFLMGEEPIVDVSLQLALLQHPRAVRVLIREQLLQ